MELLVFLELSAPEKDCSFVNIPDRSLSDIARLLHTIKYKLYLRQSATQKQKQNKNTCSNFSPPPFFQSSFCCVESVLNCFISYQNEDQIVKMQIYITVFMNSNPLYHDYSFFSIFFSDFSPCSGRHKTEAKYIAAIKLKWEVVFFLSKFDIKI